MKHLPLHGKHGEGRFALVDDDDYKAISSYRWNRDQRGYVRRSGGNGIWIRLHRQLMDAPPGLEVDHINGDKSDNRRRNLRLCTHAQNVRNSPRINPTGYRGVHRVKTPTPTWYASIRHNNKERYLGSFSTPEAAARRYDEMAVALHGEFALLNFSKS